VEKGGERCEKEYLRTSNRLSSLWRIACATVEGLIKATGLLGKRRSVFCSALVAHCKTLLSQQETASRRHPQFKLTRAKKK